MGLAASSPRARARRTLEVSAPRERGYGAAAGVGAAPSSVEACEHAPDLAQYTQSFTSLEIRII